jgi:hypothetical protein
MKKLILILVAAVAFVAMADAADGKRSSRSTLGNHTYPPDRQVTIGVDKSWGVPIWRCTENGVHAELGVFGAGGNDVGFRVDPEQQPIHWRAPDRVGTVVFNEETTRIHNFTARPIIVGMWCTRKMT